MRFAPPLTNADLPLSAWLGIARSLKRAVPDWFCPTPAEVEPPWFLRPAVPSLLSLDHPNRPSCQWVQTCPSLHWRSDRDFCRSSTVRLAASSLATRPVLASRCQNLRRTSGSPL